MKSFFIKLILILFLIPTLGQSQIKLPFKKKSEDKANEEIDDAIDEGLDGLFGKKKKKGDKPDEAEATATEEATAAAASEGTSG